MARKILFRTSSGEATIYSESQADDEAELHQLVRTHPELIPVEDLDLEGPLLVVGNESTVPSGAIDLLCLSRTGDVVVVEFKTGPENTDFRRVLAQLVDYGSHLWGMSLVSFDERVVQRCTGRSLLQCMREHWPDQTEDEQRQAADTLTAQLTSGQFKYVVAAQRFTPNVQRTVDYLNATMTSSFFAVEFVRFDADGTSAFESRLVQGPPRSGGATGGAGAALDAARFLAKYSEERYRQGMEALIGALPDAGFKIHWGPAGISFRARVEFRNEPVSLAWAFPPGTPMTWMGLRDLTLGYEKRIADRGPEVAASLQRYGDEVARIPFAQPATVEGLVVARFDGQGLEQSLDEIVSVMTAAAADLRTIRRARRGV